MKRIIFILIVILFIVSLAFPAFADPTWTYDTSRYTHDAPEYLYMHCFDSMYPANPIDHLHNVIFFEFINGQEITQEFVQTFEDPSSGLLIETKLVCNLTYDKGLLRRYDDVFINGTFNLITTQDGETTEFKGEIMGQIIMFNPSAHNLYWPESNNVAAVVLRMHSDDGDGFDQNLFLNPSTSGLMETESESEILYSGYLDHESRPHVPSPMKQADVAAGVALSTIGIAAANALTNTSTFGGASFNGSFDPTSAASGSSVVSGTTGATGSAASTAGASSATGSSGGFVGVVKEFFIRLFGSLRDMLTDEGRSFASGKLSESLGEAGIDIDIDDAGDGGD